MSTNQSMKVIFELLIYVYTEKKSVQLTQLVNFPHLHFVTYTH